MDRAVQVIFKKFRGILNYVIYCSISICLLLNAAESSDLKGGLIKVKEAEILRARCGTGPDEIGVTTPSEANPEGPMSFALGKDEEIYILDQINSRIQVFKGWKRINSIRLKKDIRFKDIALTPDNKIVLLESFFKEGEEKTSIHVLDSNGKILNVILLEGRLIPNSGEVKGIGIVTEGRLSGIWVDLGKRSVKVASLNGESVERVGVPGKLSLDGRRIFKAEKIGDATVAFYRSEKDSLSKWDLERTVNFGKALAHLLGIWDDQKGMIYLSAFLTEGQSKSSNIVVVFSPGGEEFGRLKLLVQKMPHEIWQSIRVSPDGNIFQMGLDEKGVFVRKYILTK